MTIRFCKNGFQERVYLIFTSNTVGRVLFVEVKMDPGLNLDLSDACLNESQAATSTMADNGSVNDGNPDENGHEMPARTSAATAS